MQQQQQQQVIMSFVATIGLKRQLEQWAAQEDRSTSATLRRILEQEAQRRRQQPTK